MPHYIVLMADRGKIIYLVYLAVIAQTGADPRKKCDRFPMLVLKAQGSRGSVDMDRVEFVIPGFSYCPDRHCPCINMGFFFFF